MLTPFGKEVRRIRLEREMRLLDLAMRVRKSSAFLSAVETGRKPLPAGFEDEVADALQATPKEREALRVAADGTRKSIIVSGMSNDRRQLVAEFARRVEDISDDKLSDIDIDAILSKLMKSAKGDIPFKRSRGALVSPQSYLSLWNIANSVRALFKQQEAKYLPIMDIIEFAMPSMVRGFHFDVCEAAEIDGDEARAIPAKGMILFRSDVYEDAIRGKGRARFTAAHELGHYALHSNVVFARSSDGQPIYRDAEWQADVFAGGLLMPPELFKSLGGAINVAEQCGVTYAAAEHMERLYRQKGVL